jgi:hypothetical protein
MTTYLTGAATSIAGGAANQIPYQTGKDVTGFAAAPTKSGTFLSWNGTNFVWATPSQSTGTTTQTVATATTATNLAGGVAGSLPYQSAAGVTQLLAPSTNGYVLTVVGGLPTWAPPAVAATPTNVTVSSVIPSDGVSTESFTVSPNRQLIVTRRLQVVGHLINQGRVAIL